MERHNPTIVESVSNQFRGALRRQLKELHREREAIFQESLEAIFVVEPLSGEILEANDSAVTLAGYPVSKLLGMKFSQLISAYEGGSNGQQFHKVDDRALATALLKCRNGSSIRIYIRTRFVQRGHRPCRLVFVSRMRLDKLTAQQSPAVGFTAESGADASRDTDPTYEFPNIVGKSEKIRKVCQSIGQVAKTDSTVLIQGESGTGKEIVAQAIHFHSSRSKGPFVKVNCAALSETLLESELFGHVRGAFTGAIREKRGRFKQADKGTILLDEINSMSLAGQAKFLRVLQEREFEPVGSSTTVSVNVRVIVACNANLEEAVADGTFREDLYYRLNVFSMLMPPLREKKEDIPLLARHFLKKYNLAVGKRIQDLTPETLALMVQHDWPGNVRELENAVEHAVIVGRGPFIVPQDLPCNLTEKDPGEACSNDEAPASLRDRLNLLEKQIILEALTRANGVKKQAADMLQIDPRNFPYLLRKHNLSDSGRQSRKSGGN